MRLLEDESRLLMQKLHDTNTQAGYTTEGPRCQGERFAILSSRQRTQAVPVQGLPIRLLSSVCRYAEQQPPRMTILEAHLSGQHRSAPRLLRHQLRRWRPDSELRHSTVARDPRKGRRYQQGSPASARAIKKTAVLVCQQSGQVDRI